jgi:hypothetical protein
VDEDADERALTDAVETVRQTVRVRKPTAKVADNQRVASGGKRKTL